jgi:CheY-like chemotaxis protein
VNQRVAMAILEAAGMDVILAQNGLEAIDLLQKHEFSVILMDIHMPQMDGVSATRKIRALPQPHCDIPIIALTANAMKGDRETYLAAGMDDYVAKPVDPKALAEAIRRQAGASAKKD